MKKNSINGIDRYWYVLRKALFVMKLTTLIFLISTLSLMAGESYSQDTRISLNMKNVQIKDVLLKIENSSEFFFIYNNQLIDVDRTVSINADNEKISNVLHDVFQDQQVEFQLTDRKIVIVPTEMSNQQAQTKVSGKVTDSTGGPLPGVSVVVKGTTNGTITDSNGNYSLSNIPAKATLIFSFVGMKSQEVVVGSSPTINIKLAEETIGIEEVVAIGYGTQKKADVTSSVSTVKSENFLKGSVHDAGQLIQGKVAGLTVISTSGDPSSTKSTQILLRGSSSLMGQNTNPLILIDGIPGEMNTIAPQDIESIDVLKDGSAAAIYGTRGTNGVILITSKRAGSKPSSVEYSTYFSTQTIARKLNLSTAEEFRAQIVSGDRVVVSDNGTKTYPMSDNGASTDWLKEVTRTPLTQSHNLTFRSGNEITNYLVNLNYNNSEGIFRTNYNQSFSGHIDFNHSMFNNKLKINVNLFSSSTKFDNLSYDAIYKQVLMQNPTSPVKNADGTWFQELTKFEYQSPVSDLNERYGQANNLAGRYKAAIVYTPVTGLKLSGVFSYRKTMRENGYSETKQNASTLRDSKNGYANTGGEESIDRLAELTAEYSKSIEKHNFMILGGYSYQENNYNNYFMENWDFPTDQFGYNNLGLGQAVVNGKVTDPVRTYRAATNLIGFFSRLTYNYDDKYLLMASIRREEASQLWGTNNPWGTFPAVSAGWRITNESFMKNQHLFNDIKLRVGYGITGSPPPNLFAGVGIIDYGYGNVYSNGKWLKTLVPSQNANPDLKWEEKHETDFGIDFSMLNNRISGTIDYYNRQIKDLLWLYEVPSPPNLYNRTQANSGTMENKGLEVLINFVPIKKSDFEWNTSVSYSTNKNKLKSLSNDVYKLSTDYLQVGGIFPPIQTFSHLLRVGGPVGDFYGYKVIDIGNDPADKANYGQWVYEGADGNPVKYSDFKHSFEDKKVIGNGLPKFYLGWNNNFRYKNWDLAITQRGAFKFQVANLQRMMYENPKMMQYNVLSNGFDKVFGKAKLASPVEFNSYYVEDADYWKIDNITLGYNFNKTGIKYIQSARLYASVLNAFIITGYKGVDPEVSLLNDRSTVQSGVVQTPTAGLDPGMDSQYRYPTTRTFTIGLNVTF